MRLRLSPGQAWAATAALVGAFVGSIYVWKGATRSRDHPEQIVRRFISIGVVTALSPLALLAFRDHSAALPDGASLPLLEWLGMPTGLTGHVAAAAVALLLFAVLFLGPLIVYASEATWPSLRADAADMWHPVRRLQTLRNLVVAPLAEEIVFRACCCALFVASGQSVAETIVGPPVLFGLAHAHHGIVLTYTGAATPVMALVSVAFQFSFTFLFGVLVSVVYLRTGRLVGAVLAHSFCNLVGVPNLRPLVSRDTPPRQRILFIGGYLAGVALFAALLAPLTDPHYFGSRLYALATNKSAP